ncbi:hypothetical protein M8C21_003986 [Ambrosia artemisiifolia]|uniref:Uncharacterized protein n=1 Tax=Ambrosia artemisiifolia TaxID=4212 RepID=A0AAD5CH18_AMBAR|nr:hypothetical protein M8C21_003986 [Ambrosia artemisiifolia]
MKDNEVLRALKASKQTKYPKRSLNGVDPALNDTCTPQDTTKEPDIHLGKTKRLRVPENINDSVPQPTKRASNDTSNLSKNLHKTSEHNGFPWHDCKDDDVVFLYESGHIAKDSSTPVYNPQEAAADFFFSNGLLDATNRHPSKWCKKGQNKAASGDLIAVGADGRAGTTKVLKSPNLPSLNSRGSSNSAKSRKLGAKASSLQSQGSLQINHFFSKVGQ